MRGNTPTNPIPAVPQLQPIHPMIIYAEVKIAWRVKNCPENTCDNGLDNDCPPTTIKDKNAGNEMMEQCNRVTREDSSDNAERGIEFEASTKRSGSPRPAIFSTSLTSNANPSIEGIEVTVCPPTRPYLFISYLKSI